MLRDLDLKMVPGTATSVTGRNGVGKTTLLRIITGILAPDGGIVMVDGIRPTESWPARISPPNRVPVRRRPRFVCAGHRPRASRALDRLRTRSATRAQPAGGRGARRVRSEGSGQPSRRPIVEGQRQRLRLALAVVHRPKVLLLDEPRNSLDAEGQSLLNAAVRDVLRRGGAVLCCAPAGEEHLDARDRHVVIEDGTLRPA